MNEGEPSTGCRLLLEALDLFVLKLLNLAAVEADEVVVVRVPEDVLIDELTATGVERLNEAALFQEVQGPIHGRATDRRPSLILQPRVKCVCGEVLVRFERQLKDPISLSRELQTLRAEVLLKAFSDGGVLHGDCSDRAHPRASPSGTLGSTPSPDSALFPISSATRAFRDSTLPPMSRRQNFPIQSIMS